MARLMLNDAELDALKGLSLASRVLYVEGIKPYMDYATGVVGAAGSPSKSISLQSLSEVLYVEPKQGRTDTGSRSRKQARVCIEVLIEAGLIESASIATKNQKRLVLKCILADSDVSVQNKQGTNRAHYQGTNRAQSQANNSNVLNGSHTPKQGVPETPKQGTPPLTVKHIDTHIPRAREKLTIPEKFNFDDSVKAYVSTSGVPAEFCESLVNEFRLANIASGYVSLNWPAEFMKFCLQQWRFKQSFENRAGKKRGGLRLVGGESVLSGNSDHGFDDGG